MAVYARCTKCKTRRDKTNPDSTECADKSAHKRFVAWTARVQFSRAHAPIEKSFRVDKHDKPRELAEIQERQWLTDHERGLLLPKSQLETKRFDVVADEWAKMAKLTNKVQDYDRAEKYRVEMWKKFFGAKTLDQCTFDDLEEWLEERIGNGLAVNTINRDMKPGRWIMDYAVSKGYLKENPFHKLRALKGGNIRVRWMAQAEVDKLIKAAEDIGDTDLVDVIEVALNTGFRKGNLERLTARDISETHVTALKTKSDNPYDVRITPDLEHTLARLCAEHATGPILNTVNLDKRFRKVARAAGLYGAEEDENAGKDPDKVTIHTLRHTFAALYLKRGGNLHRLSKLLGHASAAITDRVYAHICPKDLDAEAPMMSTPITRAGNEPVRLEVIG